MRKQIALAVLAALPLCAHAEMHDCTEAVTARIARVTHNIVQRVMHPMHPHFVHAAPQMCGEPDMVTVTVEAPPVMDLPDAPASSNQDTNVSGGGGIGGSYGGVVTYYAPGASPVDLTPRYTETDREHSPQPVPEPAQWAVMLAGIVIVLALMRRRIKS